MEANGWPVRDVCRKLLTRGKKFGIATFCFALKIKKKGIVTEIS